jgi:hypothetical protein
MLLIIVDVRSYYFCDGSCLMHVVVDKDRACACPESEKVERERQGAKVVGFGPRRKKTHAHGRKNTQSSSVATHFCLFSLFSLNKMQLIT